MEYIFFVSILINFIAMLLFAIRITRFERLFMSERFELCNILDDLIASVDDMNLKIQESDTNVNKSLSDMKEKPADKPMRSNNWDSMRKAFNPKQPEKDE
jgi:hypothetical protein